MNQDPLAGLRDIHMPPPVSWWPPAPGWWLLAGLLVLLVAGLLWWLRRHQQQPAASSHSRSAIIDQALSELDALQRDADRHTNRDVEKGAQNVAADLSALLRRLAMALHPDDAGLAGLSGAAWLNWLDAQWDQTAFSEGDGRALLDAPYRRHSKVEIDHLLSLVRRWIMAQR